MSGSFHTSQPTGSWRGGAEGATVSASASLRQLQELPRDELQNLAEDLGLDHTRYRSQQDLASAIYERRQMIAAMDREALLDVVRWGRRPVHANASKEQLAVEISRIKSMRFAGLSHRGLVALAVMRGVELRGDEDVASLIRKLKKQEGLFSRLNRKRRAWIGSIVSNMLGEDQAQSAEYQYLPPQPGPGQTAQTTQGHASMPGPGSLAPGRETSIKEEIEESGLFGGLASRVKRHADVYLNQKLDEIEARIDRKLDEIDRRLAEWRDKEIANRIRILKITLWASVIVAIISLLYAYVKVNFFPG
ncbi:MAG TPA: hypothetical protein VNL70_07045 [Tepidisphaeraceae bacterium]|nr:hypothetical protein [Tepidisphaeraceae bacterium]